MQAEDSYRKGMGAERECAGAIGSEQSADPKTQPGP